MASNNDKRAGVVTCLLGLLEEDAAAYEEGLGEVLRTIEPEGPGTPCPPPLTDASPPDPPPPPLVGPSDPEGT